MNKFDKLYNKIITEMIDNTKELPLSSEEKNNIKTLLEKTFDNMSPVAIKKSAQMAIRDMEWPFKNSGEEKNTEQYKKAIEYLDKFIDSPFNR